MGKGLKMEAAKKKDCGNRIFHITNLSKEDNGNLKCHCCSTKVEYVPTHTKKSSKNPVPAYLRLCKGAIHKEGCRYLVKNAVDRLVADSQAIENISPIFEFQDDGTYLFRMNILVEAQKVAKELANIESASTQEIEKVFTGKKYVKTQQVLPSYFRSATGIAKLRALIEDSNSSDLKQLRKILKIQYKDEYVSWNDFYYDDTRYHVLFNRLQKGKLSHPVALNVRVKREADYYDKAKWCPWSFQCYSDIVERDGKKRVYIPKIKVAKNNLIQQIKVDKNYLVVGDVWVDIPKNKESIFRNINIGVFNKSQFKIEIS